MGDSAKGVLELLEELRRERAELDVLILGLEKRLGIVQQAGDKDGTPAQTPKVTVSVDSIPVGFFHNLSQAASTEKLLRMNPGHPLTTNEILEAFRKSGMDVNPKNAVTILYTTLKRSPKFERVAGKAWGLAEWYPERRKKNLKDEDETSDSEEGA
jgi:hypothetical protein